MAWHDDAEIVAGAVVVIVDNIPCALRVAATLALTIRFVVERAISLRLGATFWISIPAEREIARI